MTAILWMKDKKRRSRNTSSFFMYFASTEQNIHNAPKGVHHATEGGTKLAKHYVLTTFALCTSLCSALCVHFVHSTIFHTRLRRNFDFLRLLVDHNTFHYTKKTYSSKSFCYTFLYTYVYFCVKQWLITISIL